MPPQALTTGIEALDDLLGGVRVGDNVVWETDSGAPTDAFLAPFVRAAGKGRQRVVFVSFNSSPQTALTRVRAWAAPADLTLLDCFTSGKGEGDPVFAAFYESGEGQGSGSVVRVSSPANPGEVQSALAALERQHGPDRYVFDSLTGMLELWAHEAQVLRFFAHVCPKLYDLRTVAYWLLEKGAHSESFLANLKHITQVFIELCIVEGKDQLVPRKLVGRENARIGVAHPFKVRDGQPDFGVAALGGGEEEALRALGPRMRTLRQQRGLSQARVAEMAGLSPSAISQMESGAIRPSLTVLLRIALALGVGVNALLGE